MINGMVLGLRHQTPEDIEEPFQQTGTLHLFAVAGLHVGIVAQLLWILATLVRLSRKWATAVIIPLLLFYAAITGLHVSSMRAAVMSSVLLAGFFFGRKVFVLNSSALSVVFNNVNWSLVSAVIAFVNWFAAVPGSHYYVANPHWPKALDAKITVLDLGAGAAVHLHGSGADWLFDCGSARDYARVL